MPKSIKYFIILPIVLLVLLFVVKKIPTKSSDSKIINLSTNELNSDLYSPSDLKSTKITNSSITITWKFPDNRFVPKDNAIEKGILSGFRIYRDGYWFIDTTNLERTFTDNGLYPNELYRYKVSALTFDNKIEGQTSLEIEVKTPNGDPKPITPFSKNSYNHYLALGDSVTEGAIAAKGNGWVDQIGRYLASNNPKLLVINKGIMAAISSTVSSQITSEIQENNPDIISIAIGLNDSVNGVNLGLLGAGTYKDNLRKTLNEIKAYQKADVFLLSIYYVDCCYEKVPVWNKVVRDVANEYQIPYIDVYTPVKENGGDSLIVGGGHPKQAGHDIIAQTVIQRLKELTKP